jgi:hypothetical protein
MSSILDALEKLESRRAAGASPEPPRQRPRSPTPLLAGAALVAFVAGIGLTAAWMRGVPEVAAPALPGPSAPVAAPAPPATLQEAPRAAAARVVEAPWAEVVTPPAPRRAAEGPDATNTADTFAAVATTADPEPHASEAAPPAAPRPAGAPSVHVSFLVYSTTPERRSVALTIDDGGLVTLREGEASGGLSVVQILTDGVELAWQGESFVVRARN